MPNSASGQKDTKVPVLGPRGVRKAILEKQIYSQEEWEEIARDAVKIERLSQIHLIAYRRGYNRVNRSLASKTTKSHSSLMLFHYQSLQSRPDLYSTLDEKEKILFESGFDKGILSSTEKLLFKSTEEVIKNIVHTKIASFKSTIYGKLAREQRQDDKQYLNELVQQKIETDFKSFSQQLGKKLFSLGRTPDSNLPLAYRQEARSTFLNFYPNANIPDPLPSQTTTATMTP